MSEGARLTPADMDAAFEAMRKQASRPPEPRRYFVGDNFPLAKRMVEDGYHILCSSRVRTLLGEHIVD